MRKFLQLNQHERKIVGLSSLGGMLEFYDFVIYGIFSVYFANQFFPSDNYLLSIIESYAVFMLGYLARPLGGILFSHIGDEYGRKKVLVMTILLMGVSSCGIGLLPTYDTIGVFAPVLLLILRLLQGVAVGGELPSAYVYISESLPGKKSISFSSTMVGVNAGVLFGMLINQGLLVILTNAQIVSFGWRIPFFIGGAICFISYRIRNTLNETTEFQQISDRPQFPLLYLVRNNLPQLLSSVAIMSVMAGLVVIVTIFLPTYLRNILHIDSQIVGKMMLLVMVVNLLAIFLTGYLTTLFAPQKILKIVALLNFVFVPLIFWLLQHNIILPSLIMLAILEGVFVMVVPWIVTDIFPAKIRLNGVALSYNIGFTIFGGLAPIIITESINLGGSIYYTPVIYILAITLLMKFGIFILKKNKMVDGI